MKKSRAIVNLFFVFIIVPLVSFGQIDASNFIENSFLLKKNKIKKAILTSKNRKVDYEFNNLGNTVKKLYYEKDSISGITHFDYKDDLLVSKYKLDKELDTVFMIVYSYLDGNLITEIEERGNLRIESNYSDLINGNKKLERTDYYLGRKRFVQIIEYDSYGIQVSLKDLSELTTKKEETVIKDSLVEMTQYDSNDNIIRVTTIHLTKDYKPKKVKIVNDKRKIYFVEPDEPSMVDTTFEEFTFKYNELGLLKSGINNLNNEVVERYEIEYFK